MPIGKANLNIEKSIIKYIVQLNSPLQINRLNKMKMGRISSLLVQNTNKLPKLILE